MLEHSHIEIGFQVYAVEGGEEFGAVRGYVPNANALIIYIENAGDFVVPLEAVHRVHDGKVIVDVGGLTHVYARPSPMPTTARNLGPDSSWSLRVAVASGDLSHAFATSSLRQRRRIFPRSGT